MEGKRRGRREEEEKGEGKMEVEEKREGEEKGGRVSKSQGRSRGEKA